MQPRAPSGVPPARAAKGRPLGEPPALAAEAVAQVVRLPAEGARAAAVLRLWAAGAFLQAAGQRAWAEIVRAVVAVQRSAEAARRVAEEEPQPKGEARQAAALGLAMVEAQRAAVEERPEAGVRSHPGGLAWWEVAALAAAAVARETVASPPRVA
jgi:hypothetical protein